MVCQVRCCTCWLSIKFQTNTDLGYKLRNKGQEQFASPKTGPAEPVWLLQPWQDQYFFSLGTVTKGYRLLLAWYS